MSELTFLEYALLITLFFLLLAAWRFLFPAKQNDELSSIVGQLMSMTQDQQQKTNHLISQLYESQQKTQMTLIEILRTQQSMIQASTGLDPLMLQKLSQLDAEQLKEVGRLLEEASLS